MNNQEKVKQEAEQEVERLLRLGETDLDAMSKAAREKAKEALLQSRQAVTARLERVQHLLKLWVKLKETLGKHVEQDEVFDPWLQLGDDVWPRLQKIHKGFDAGDVTEYYMIDLLDFKHWTLHGLQVDDEQMVKHTPRVNYCYSLFRPVPVSDHFTILGFSYRTDDEGTYLLVHCLVGEQKYPTLLHLHKELVGLHAGGQELDGEFFDSVKDDVTLLGTLAKLIPQYVSITRVELVERKPKVGVLAKAGFRNKPPQQPKRYRVIKAVKRIYTGEVGRSITWNAPGHRVHVGGFWRKIKGLGRDQEGRPTVGRTWVKGHTRWNDKPEAEQRVVWVKEPLRDVLEGGPEGDTNVQNEARGGGGAPGGVHEPGGTDQDPHQGSTGGPSPGADSGPQTTL